MNNPIVEFKNFSYIYPKTEKIVLDGINLSIYEGEFVGIIGCNKAGKSTLCQSMVGVLPHLLGGKWDGDVLVDGINLGETKGAGATDVIGIVFQDAESQFTQETVEDEIAFAMCNFGYERSVMRERIISAATDCGLIDMLDRSPFKLSGGQQQRLAVACILALQPRVIILDESTSQLDPIGRDEVFNLVAKLHQQGRTIIMVDHNVEKIAEYVEKLVVMDKGKIILADKAEDAFQKMEFLEQFNIRVPQVTEACLKMKECLEIDKAPIKLENAIQLLQIKLEGTNFE
ncbi:ABC transporter ATP-binding protein [Clostridiales bacterium COT073_COT-073]|nr:ABC transporter ATP-binding protein [Clostridiales bacterium COT073_COT-073]